MGYFSNGTEGELYFEKYCAKCIHEQNGKQCPVWDMHLIRNAEGFNITEATLDMFIPRSEDRLNNEQCRMFVPRQDVTKSVTHEQEIKKLRQWNDGLPIPTAPIA
jgi:hypothetical protein